ncbi:hypothetical protein ACXM5X_32745 [Pseudomonas saponiphila]|jgi:hypothetical protein|uniref:hypothetical protein n=1 Tax=Pseudomonas lundensis TaxID=86185 RepID=UPI00064219DF|nr:hypothetical protein [Pseudomonas lundensis]
MALTIEQKIAQKEAELARLRNQSRALENGQKIILGGMLLAEARKDAKIRQWLLSMVQATVKRDVDQRRLAPLIDELAALDKTL